VSARLRGWYQALCGRIDGAALVQEALAGGAPAGAHLLAVGKVAVPMFEGFTALAPPAAALLVAPAGAGSVPSAARLLESDHPRPSARSVAAAKEARAFVAALGPADRLVVLLSGGGSALLASPHQGLTLDDKRTAVAMVARAGATIGELNTVRKHLSAIKGGRLALATRAATTVLALSDVVGSDPGTIASGPLSADPTSFADALALVRRLAPGAPEAVVELLERGAAGMLAETPKPGDPRLAHVSYRVLAGPERVAVEARRLVEAAGERAGVLALATERDVESLGAEYGVRAREAQAEARPGEPPLVLIGHGEPRIVVRGEGAGGRATHLALLVARAIAGLSGVTFLAAGTDRLDGSAPAAGAVVDSETWPHAVAAGLDPQGALDRCDSARPLAALGALVEGPGRSNLLDVHLLRIAAR
jgi:glycerate 2-kinase